MRERVPRRSRWLNHEFKPGSGSALLSDLAQRSELLTQALANLGLLTLALVFAGQRSPALGLAPLASSCHPRLPRRI